MSMFCFQCQETLRNEGCTQHGMCGKSSDCSNLMDVLLYSVRGLALAVELAEIPVPDNVGPHIERVLFTTITNANFDELRIESLIRETLRMRNEILHDYEEKFSDRTDDILFWNAATRNEFLAKSPTTSVLMVTNPDIRSMREMLMYGMKGTAAYAWHARRLGFVNDEIHQFLIHRLAQTSQSSHCTTENLLRLLRECGKTALSAMQLLNAANTHHFGEPEPTLVRTTPGTRPGILVSGHDLCDLEDLLIQTMDVGIDIYTHGEMLPANAYPELKKFPHLHGNYGGSWWRQNLEFESFNGPILMTSNCLIPLRECYKNRIFTTGTAGWPGIRHIPEPTVGHLKDFSEIIRLAKTLPPPEPLGIPADGTAEPEYLTIGFGFAQLKKSSEEIMAGLKSGEIRQILIMAGCDGRHASRRYFEELVKNVPHDTLILTAGCAKYRGNHLELGSIGNLPRFLDAGQCNDSWSILSFLNELREMMNVKDINALPVHFHIAWYEQKAVCVLLAMIALGVRNIHLGPTLPAFCSRNVLQYLTENHSLRKTGKIEEDLDAFQNEEKLLEKS